MIVFHDFSLIFKITRKLKAFIPLNNLTNKWFSLSRSAVTVVTDGEQHRCSMYWNGIYNHLFAVAVTVVLYVSGLESIDI